MLLIIVSNVDSNPTFSARSKRLKVMPLPRECDSNSSTVSPNYVSSSVSGEIRILIQVTRASEVCGIHEVATIAVYDSDERIEADTVASQRGPLEGTLGRRKILVPLYESRDVCLGVITGYGRIESNSRYAARVPQLAYVGRVDDIATSRIQFENKCVIVGFKNITSQ